MPLTSYNERSWAIDLISDCNIWLHDKDTLIKRAGGEHGLKASSRTLFPDVLLFGDHESGMVLQGWELKMPDTPIDDAELIENAHKKAEALGLESFLVWNVSYAALYKIENRKPKIIHEWNELSHIDSRELVLENMPAIRQQMGNILRTLNGYFEEGIIKPSRIIDSITGEGIISMLLSNVHAYAHALEHQSSKDSGLEDEVNLWWYSAKLDYSQSSNKWMVLAQNNLIGLLSKFVFAHVLKQYNFGANLVNDITEEVSVENGLKSFEQISAQADFWNVFSTGLGEQQLPDVAWQSYISLNATLKDFQIDSIDIQTVHDLLENLLERSRRKAAGQYATPYPLAKLLVALVVRDPEAHCLDPCCGSGTISRAIYEHKARRGVTNPLSSTWASDKFALPLKMATLSLLHPDSMGQVMQLFKADVSKLRDITQVSFKNPKDGSVVKRALPKFSYILSNLPFVQQEDIDKLNPDINSINDDLTRQLGNVSFTLTPRSDMYMYLPFYLWEILEDDGYLGIIVSNSWLGTDAGKVFYRALQRYYSVETVITSGRGRWFNNAKVVTNIIVLKKRSNPKLVSESKTKFVTLKQPVEDIDDDAMMSIRAIIASHMSYEDRLLKVVSHDSTAQTFATDLSLPTSSLFTNLDWLEKVSVATVEVTELFDVGRGERRGWDELFFPSNPGVIEPEYLKPVLKTPSSTNGLIAEPDSLAFCCTLSKDELKVKGHEGALRWIESFENKTNEVGLPLPEALARSGMHWYTLLPDTLANFATALNPGDRLFIAKANKPVFVNQRLTRLSVKDNTLDTDLVHALMNSILGLFYLEALGFGRGEGVLDLNSTKVKRAFRVFDPNALTPEQKKDIIEHFEPLLHRPVMHLSDELNMPDRQNFDTVVLRHYGHESTYPLIKQSLLDLYMIRSAVSR